MTLPGEGVIPDKCIDCGSKLEPQILHTPAGYYIGAQCDQCGPYCRASDYYPTREAAEADLKMYTPRTSEYTGF